MAFDPGVPVAWWLCPNDPPCPHGSVLHDVNEMDDPRPTCGAEGCDCGQPDQPGAGRPEGGAAPSWADSTALVASGGWCAPASPTYSFFDLTALGHPDLSWWWDTDVDMWLFPRLTAAQRFVREARRRVVVAARVLHHGYGWRSEPDPD